MSGGISASGLITGIDSGSIIAQLMAIERQPVTRMQTRINAMEGQKTALRGLRTQLLTLRSRLQDFRITSKFKSFSASSSKEEFLTASISGQAPPQGAFKVEVLQLASATVARSDNRISEAVDANVALKDSGFNQTVTSGEFTINGLKFNVDVENDSLQDILDAINASAAGVTASYDAGTDKVTIANTVPGNTGIINFGSTSDTSNMLSALRVTQATQTTNGSGSTSVSSTGLLGAVSTSEKLTTQSFDGGALSGGTFSINGVSIAIDPLEDTLSDVLDRINSSEANVTATYDASQDKIRIQSTVLGSRTINFGGAGDTSNFLSIMNLDTATQTAGNDSQFKIDDGAILTRNANEVSDALDGVTLRFVDAGVSTVTINTDNSAAVDAIKAFITEFNNVTSTLKTATAVDGRLNNDSSIRAIDSNLRSQLFAQTSGTGIYKSLAEVGFNTGKEFDSAAAMQLQLDEKQFLEALGENRSSVERLFANDDGTGIMDKLYQYVDEITLATGFLNVRSRNNGTIDSQIKLANDRITSMEERLTVRENRLRRTFSKLETTSAGLQQQSTAISGLASRMRYF